MPLNPLRKKETQENRFQVINAAVRGKIAAIEKIPDLARRLAQYQALQESFKTLYGDPDSQIQKTADSVTSGRGDANMLTGLSGGTGAFLSGIALCLFPPALPAAAVVGASAAYVGRRLLFNSMAKSTGFTREDIKYIVETNSLKSKVRSVVYRLSDKVEKQKTALKKQQDIAKLRAELGAPASKPVTPTL